MPSYETCFFRTLAAVLTFGATLATAPAATITVNSTNDPAGFNTAITTNGLGATITLRDAINAAKNSGATNTIVFDPTLAGKTFYLTNSQDSSLGVSAFFFSASTLTIQGPTNGGIIIDGRGALRPFRIFSSGNLTLNDITFTNCAAGGGSGGGVIHNANKLQMNRCTLSGNSSTNNGATLLNYVNGNAVLANCTIMGNIAFNAGGIYNQGSSLALLNVTLSRNTNTITSTFSVGGLLNVSGSAVALTNTIVAGNYRAGGGVPADLDGPAVAQNSIIGTAGTSGLINGVNSNLVGITETALNLGPLASNGGNTKTAALLAGSPAINAGMNLAEITVDQRGRGRPQFGATDIGAYELSAFDTGQTIITAGGASWYIGTPAQGNDLTIYREVAGQPPVAVDGYALLIGQANDGTVLVRNSTGNIYPRVGSTSGIGSGWAQSPSVFAGDGATWFLGPDSSFGSLSIYRWASNGLPAFSNGAGTNLVVLYDGSILTRANDQTTWRRIGSSTGLGSSWQQVFLATPAAKIQNPTRLPTGNFQFGFTNQSSRTLTVLMTTNVTLPMSQWTVLGAPVESPAGSYQFTDTTATNSPRRFYRITSP